MKRSELRASPEAIRKFNERAREKRRAAAAMPGIVRQGLPDPRAPLARKPRKRRAPIPAETRIAVRARSDGKCVVCVYLGVARPRKAEHLHHCFPVQRWPMLVAVGDGIVGACSPHHMDHEFAPDKRIPLLALPECVFRLAADVGPAAVDYLLKTYAL